MCAYYEHLRHPRKLIIKKLDVKRRQEICSFFKSVSVSVVVNESVSKLPYSNFVLYWLACIL